MYKLLNPHRPIECPLCHSTLYWPQNGLTNPGLRFECPRCQEWIVWQRVETQERKVKALPLCGCGAEMVERHGKYGSFLGCSAYPKCKGKRRAGEFRMIVEYVTVSQLAEWAPSTEPDMVDWEGYTASLEREDRRQAMVDRVRQKRYN